MGQIRVFMTLDQLRDLLQLPVSAQIVTIDQVVSDAQPVVALVIQHPVIPETPEIRTGELKYAKTPFEGFLIHPAEIAQ